MGVFDGVELDELVLHGARLTLRPWQASDAERVYEIMQDRGMHEFLALPDPYTRADAARFVTELGDEGRRDGIGLGCAVTETDGGRVVGSAALHHLDRYVEVGYWIAPDAQGHGYAAEATRTLTSWAFEHGRRRVELCCDVRNLASAGTALAAGFGYEGTRRDFVLYPTDGQAAPRVGDLAWFARLAGDDGAAVAPTFPRFPQGGLSDGVVLLRPTVPADADGWLAEHSDPVTVGVGFAASAPTAADARRSCDRAGLDWLVGGAAALTIEDVATGSYAGGVHLRRSGPPGVGGIGYGVHPAFRGRGYTARALRLLAPWAFGDGSFTRLELGAKAHNLASQKAALAAGFSADGVRTARLRNPDGTYSDEVRFCLLSRA